ncbi:MAG: outer membrane beta-barrel protein [Pontiellaceae bacterium]|jgi:opacity protein-like surface antigen|nr:outer membrane beta-barrel protein [Pontiellaceae bacterium]
MNKMRLWLPVLVGFVMTNGFAEGEQPFKIINTIRVGYNDNLYHSPDGSEEDTVFVTDTIDLSYHAAFSDRTDLMLKSRVNVQSDTEGTDVYPQLFATLNHSVSPRVLLGLSEHFQSGDRTGRDGYTAANTRLGFFENTAGLSADYLFNEKNRMSVSGNYTVLRNEDDEKWVQNDYTTIGGGLSWNHEIFPHRTFSSLNLNHRYTDYDNRTNTTFDATDIYLGIGHTFNPEWQCNFNIGESYVSPSVEGAGSTSKSSMSPLVSAGLVYSPSPMTKLSADADYRYSESGDRRFGGQKTAVFSLGAQHNLTAKLGAKATVRFANIEYDEDAAIAGSDSSKEDRLDIDFRLTYRLNRIHSLEAGIRHSEKDRDTVIDQDWKQNVVDLGWRVELN